MIDRTPPQRSAYEVEELAVGDTDIRISPNLESNGVGFHVHYRQPTVTNTQSRGLI